MGNLLVTEAVHYNTGKPVRVEAEDGIIASVKGQSGELTTGNPVYIAPGFIDDQINGYAGIDFSGDNFSPDDLYKAATEIWKTGVTTFLPTLVTNRPFTG